jgi:hypothetical protein
MKPFKKALFLIEPSALTAGELLEDVIRVHNLLLSCRLRWGFTDRELERQHNLGCDLFHNSGGNEFHHFCLKLLNARRIESVIYRGKAVKTIFDSKGQGGILVMQVSLFESGSVPTFKKEFTFYDD